MKFYGWLCLFRIGVAHSSQGETEILTIPERFKPAYNFAFVGTGNNSLPFAINVSPYGIVNMKNLHSGEAGAFGTELYTTNS